MRLISIKSQKHESVFIYSNCPTHHDSDLEVARGTLYADSSSSSSSFEGKESYSKHQLPASSIVTFGLFSFASIS